MPGGLMQIVARGVGPPYMFTSSHITTVIQTTTKKRIFKEVESDEECAVCTEKSCNVKFECNHMICKECMEKVTKCPYCRRNICIKKDIIEN